jgi:hypothetical protein
LRFDKKKSKDCVIDKIMYFNETAAKTIQKNISGVEMSFEVKINLSVIQLIILYFVKFDDIFA